MGSSSSKAARKLPTTTPSATRAAPPPPPQPSWTVARPHAQGETAQPAPHVGSAPVEAEASAGGAVYPNPGAEEGVQPGQPGGRPGLPGGHKEAAIRRDGMDPQFASNLSQLGQVRIGDAGKFMRVPSPAQRTLNARSSEFTSSSAAPPPNHLTASILISLLDRIKTLAPGPASDLNKVYSEYGMQPETMAVLRRWVNSPSIGGTDVVRVEDGEEIREMHAVWVDGADAQPRRLA